MLQYFMVESALPKSQVVLATKDYKSQRKETYKLLTWDLVQPIISV